jgi:nicotinamide mononucleotide transporter
MLETTFMLWGTAVTWLEVVAFVLSIACVAFNIAEQHWGWPLAIVSSLLYVWLFYASKLYGDGSLQIFFALTGAWGWAQWLMGKRDNKPLTITKLTRSQVLWSIAAWLAAWGALGLFLRRFTDTDVPWFDVFPTAGSVLGTVLLARKYIENWPVWVVVNVVSVALFVYKHLYLTAILYVIFIAMALWGWQVWREKLSGA